MRIICEVVEGGTTNTGKPRFDIRCEHCRVAFIDLSAWVYRECRERGIEPSKDPNLAAQTFTWVVNSGYRPQKLSRQLCFCDENPTGIVGRWFRTNSRLIDKGELEAACDQIRLYALKDGLDPDCKEADDAVKELRAEVKKHNAALRSKA